MKKLAVGFKCVCSMVVCYYWAAASVRAAKVVTSYIDILAEAVNEVKTEEEK